MPATNLIRWKISLYWFSRVFRHYRCTLPTISFGSSHSSFINSVTNTEQTLAVVVKEGWKNPRFRGLTDLPLGLPTLHMAVATGKTADTVRRVCISTPLCLTCRFGGKSAATRSVKFSYRMNWKIVGGGIKRNRIMQSMSTVEKNSSKYFKVRATVNWGMCSL
jgi:hypothetical protein